ncbi:MAG TPA: M28 family metallopeptidase [Kofleriaceae bacterium]
MRALAIAIVLAACSAGTPGPGIDVERALGHVRALAQTPRPRDSQASRAAADYIVAQLAGISVERMAVGAVDLPAIEVMGRRYREAHRVTTTDPNLIVRFGPPGKALLIMAHYDTVAKSPGAIDNAAAVGTLIELARDFAASPPPVPVMIVFTANEEIGLVGAEALAAKRGDQIGFAIALDLVGGTGELIINGASELIGKSELRWIASAADRSGTVVRAPLAHRVISRWWPQAERSDHGPFTRRGIRAVHFYNRGHDGNWIDLAYHSERDVPARVDRERLAELGRLLHALATTPIPPHGGDGFWLPVVAHTVIPRWLLLVGCLAFAAAAIALAISLRGPRVDHGKLGLLAGIVCYALAVGAALAVEHASARWIHAPLRSAMAESLVIVSVLGLLATLAGRFARWTGERRYLLVAIVMPLGFGLTLFAIGAAELAWIWLVPAAIAALAPRLGPARVSAALVGLPVLVVLDPDRLREAVWNGFLPPGFPLALALGVLGIPLAGVAGWLARRRIHSGPLGTLVIPMGCLVAGIVGVTLALTAETTCNRTQFVELGLACETRSGVH